MRDLCVCTKRVFCDSATTNLIHFYWLCSRMLTSLFEFRLKSQRDKIKWACEKSKIIFNLSLDFSYTRLFQLTGNVESTCNVWIVSNAFLWHWWDIIDCLPFKNFCQRPYTNPVIKSKCEKNQMTSWRLFCFFSWLI